jgi:hypothetical protein
MFSENHQQITSFKKQNDSSKQPNYAGQKKNSMA